MYLHVALQDTCTSFLGPPSLLLLLVGGAALLPPSEASSGKQKGRRSKSTRTSGLRCHKYTGWNQVGPALLCCWLTYVSVFLPIANMDVKSALLFGVPPPPPPHNLGCPC